MANKHMPYDLAQMQSLPLRAKIIMTKQRIRQWYEHWDGMVYVSFSGGKDSTVLKHIVDSMYDDVPALFVNTGLEYPEIQKFAMSQKNVVTVRPEMRFDEVIKNHGYPVISKAAAHAIDIGKRNPDGKVRKNMFNPENKGMFGFHRWEYLIDAPFDVSDKCCYIMKKKPSAKYAKETGRKPIIGTLADESKLRYSAWLKNGCNAFGGKNPSSQPLSFWTEQDILHYIKKYKVPYCSVYGEIVTRDADGYPCYVSAGYIESFPDTKLYTTDCDRTGCVYCAFGCQREATPNRFQKLKETHPRQYEYCINGGEYVDGKWQPSKEGLGLGKVLDYIGVKYD